MLQSMRPGNTKPYRGEGMTNGFAPFRWMQEDAREWPWELNERVTLQHPLCFAFHATTISEDEDEPGGMKVSLELCVKAIGHDQGEHEPVVHLLLLNAPGFITHGMVYDISNKLQFYLPKSVQPSAAGGAKFEPTWKYRLREDDALLHVYSMVDPLSGEQMKIGSF